MDLLSLSDYLLCILMIIIMIPTLIILVLVILDNNSNINCNNDNKTICELNYKDDFRQLKTIFQDTRPVTDNAA